MTRPKKAPRRCINGHDLNVEENWVWRVDKVGRDYKRCKPCLESSGQSERRRKSQEWHAQRVEDREGVRRNAGIPDPREHWVKDAMCANAWVNSDIFFADWGEEEAVDTCGTCPVQTDCLAANLYEKYGVFGGTTPDRRDQLRRNGRRNLTNRARR